MEAPMPHAHPALALIGAGGHAAIHHLPALRAVAEAGTPFRLLAVCDRDPARAAEAARPWGARAVTRWEDAVEGADAAIVCVPSSATPDLAEAMSRHGLPLLIEKPLATGLARAEALVGGLSGPAMMSLNRRFAPVVSEARAWLRGRMVRRLHGEMHRVDRREEAFLAETGLHLIDLMVDLGGDPAPGAVRRRVGVDDHLRWTTTGGVAASVAITPRVGVNREFIDLSGDGWELHLDVFDSRLELREGMTVACRWSLPAGTAVETASGTVAETRAFLAALAGTAPWWPTPAQALPATRLCHMPVEA
jgi:predicted dehydrogenase